MVRKRSVTMRNRMKSLVKNRKDTRVGEENLTIKEQIEILESKIKLCQDDLIKFSKNLLIRRKMENMENQIKKLESEK